MESRDPFEILTPYERWVPTREQMDLLQNKYEQLLPPLVHKIREAVYKWRDDNYEGATQTTKSLFNFWFNTEHKNGDNVFQFYFSQREAIESIVYLYEIAKAKDKFELMRFDSSGRISTGMFQETWTRYVIKMATGTGKTKVMGLALVWSYFQKLYEAESPLSKNFLIIAPNIIVLNRLKKDFDNNIIMFREEPFIPDNGFDDRDWKNDFQLTVHIQDDVKPLTDCGNLFLTNIHRVYLQEEQTTPEDDFLGPKPKADADTSKGLDLGKILRSGKLKDLVVMNDEAHHIHDSELQWFKCIEEISNKLKLRFGNGISLQVDCTATPRHTDGGIFVQTICDYPLVEAIRHQVVKSPVLPDEASRSKILEKPSDDFVERYRDFIHLGYIEWKKQYDELKKLKTPILFVMTTNTSEADQTAEYLKATYPELKGAVLTIHTNKSGDINETSKSKQDKDELDKLRKAADEVDEDFSPYKAVVSVLMLREGWDVKNVMTIIGLRPYKAEAKILPEQTLGRGLRKMFGLNSEEELVVVGTEAFINFVEELKTEGVEFEYRPMGPNVRGKNPIIIEVDKENVKKDIDSLDITIPVLSPRIYREYKNLDLIDVDKLEFKPVGYKTFSENELKEIVFKDIDDKISHKTLFYDSIPDYRNVIAFFVKNILMQSRLFSGFDILYPKVEDFIKRKLFGKEADLTNPQTIRNLSEIEAKNTIYQSFKKAIDSLTISDKGSAEVRNFIKLSNTKPIVVNNQEYFIPKKSVYNKVTGDSHFELEFASFLDNYCDDIISFAKNHNGIYFKMEYQGTDGNIHDYFPDFFVKTKANTYIVETKGREDLEDIRKIERLKQWCKDVNAVQNEGTYIPVYVKEEDFKANLTSIKIFADVLALYGL